MPPRVADVACHEDKPGSGKGLWISVNRARPHPAHRPAVRSRVARPAPRSWPAGGGRKEWGAARALGETPVWSCRSSFPGMTSTKAPASGGGPAPERPSRGNGDAPMRPMLLFRWGVYISLGAPATPGGAAAAVYTARAVLVRAFAALIVARVSSAGSPT